MNRTKLKNYAPLARKEFIQAVTDRAAFYGLTTKNSEPITEQGDVAIIAGKAFPRAVARKRGGLEERIARQGFEQTMEAMAYTWFNRFVAIRFMELHGYLDHGYRVLSHPEGKRTPEILEHAEHVELPRLDKNTVIDLKLDGSKEAELYRLLLTAQCNALHEAMPFLFEQIDDETELLLPDNLLHSDSLIRKLVNEIDEEDWREVEIIGWLYQFYISEKKDQVIGKVVKSEDIPAATQLFTPNWIVKYLVQNSLGRQWLATYPTSTLRQQMEYYIEPAEQTPEVQAQLKAITPESLDPEELTLLDPACGSGHILVEAYDLFKAIYQERGYRGRDIPTLILRKNLFGLEIDDRAAQLAAFALMMKARADDRRIFAGGVQPNILSIQESKGLNAKALCDALNVPLAQGEKGNISPTDIVDLINLFEHGKTFGSLIQVPPTLAEKLPVIGHRGRDVLAHGDLMTQPAAKVLLPLIEQAWMLGRQYDCVVANPPYMGGKFCNSLLKSFLKDKYKGHKNDVFSASIIRGVESTRYGGFCGYVVPFNWMFLSSYDDLRDAILSRLALQTLTQLEFNAFEPAMVSVCVMTLQNSPLENNRGSYIRLSAFRGAENQAPKTLEAIENHNCGWFYTAKQSDFRSIPGHPIAYWISARMRQCFQEGTPLGEIAELGQGMATSDNARFLRRWYEVNLTKVGLGYQDRASAKVSRLKWFPYNKGGEFRRWFGNNEYLVNWENDGDEVLEYAAKLYGSPTRTIKNIAQYFRPALTWTTSSSSYFGIRHSDAGFLFDVKGSSCFPKEEDHFLLLGLLSSKQVTAFLACLNPTIEFQTGNIATIPIIETILSPSFKATADMIVREEVQLARTDWDSSETSWDFQILSVLQFKAGTLQQSQGAADAEVLARFQRMKQLEEENNRLFIEAYGLQDELSPEVPENQITLARPDREEDIKRLISYAIGCMMGRYSLDKLGLIYAHSGNQNFDPSLYTTFPADLDGIVPMMDTGWFSDDAVNRFVEFIGVAWPKEHVEENLTFIAESLSTNRGEQSRDTIRRYLAQGFFKDHLKTYKRRPIYWLFTSGKQRAFQCLVYLHRYNEGTLSRIRTEYVIPLQGKLNARIEHLTNDALQATSTSHRKKLEKEQDALRKQQAELIAFDEKLRHSADMRISLDLDDGVKVNYGKFADLLAEVKAVCGEE